MREIESEPKQRSNRWAVALVIGAIAALGTTAAWIGYLIITSVQR